MSESKIAEKAQEIAGKAFDKALENSEPLSTALAHRFGSPVFYSFLISWAIINWERIFVLAFGKGEIESRIEKAKLVPSTFWGVEHSTTYYLPLLSTIFIVFLSPYLNNFVDIFHTKAFRTKYIHTSKLEAEKYNAQKEAVTAKVTYERAASSLRLKIEAEDAVNTSKIEISALNLDSAKQELGDIRDKVSEERNKAEDIRKNHNQLNKEISLLNEKLTELDSTLSERVKTLEQLDKEITNRSAKLKSTQENLNIVRGDLDAFNFQRKVAENSTRALGLKD